MGAAVLDETSTQRKSVFKSKIFQDTSVLFCFIMPIFNTKILNKSDMSLNKRNF